MSEFEFPPPNTEKVETFAIAVATLPDQSTQVAIEIPDSEHPPKFETFRDGCECLMSVVAQNSNAGFEAGLELLVKGAMVFKNIHRPPLNLRPKQGEGT